jgi:hypothetical protein
MMPNSKPTTNPIAPCSRIGRLAKSKTLIVACLLSSAAMLGEPQVAYARDGVNGFVAGALLGGAMRGFGTPRARVYRGGRTYQRSARRHHRDRGTRSRDSAPEEKAPPGLGEASAGPGTGVSGAAAAAITDTTASNAATSGAASSGDTAAFARKPGSRRSGAGFGTVKKQLD